MLNRAYVTSSYGRVEIVSKSILKDVNWMFLYSDEWEKSSFHAIYQQDSYFQTISLLNIMEL